MFKMQNKVFELTERIKELSFSSYRCEKILKNISTSSTASGLSWSDVFYFIRSREELKRKIIASLKEELALIREEHSKFEKELKKLDDLL